MSRTAKINSFEIGGITIQPGQRASAEFEVAKLYTHSQLSLTAEILHGKQSGPVLMINAAIHGDELNGVEIVRQILERINPSTLKGTIIAIPVVNVFGFIHKSRYLPDRRDLNRCFPGTEYGSIAGRMAYQIFEQIVRRCTHIIDLHTAAIYHTNLPQIRANLINEATNDMALAFGTPVVIDAILRNGSLRSEAENIGISVITYEAGEALRFEPYAITAGIKGIKRVMRHLGMIRKNNLKTSTIKPVIARATRWIRAETDGILRSHAFLGQRVSKDQSLASISSPVGNGGLQIFAPQGGIIIGQQTLPLVNEGDAIFHIAYFEEPDCMVEQQVENYLDEVVDDANNDIKFGISTV
ncbi:succinylglutamate desuccinylase/aspartoacylase family protein [Candidatus Enterovibrio altilux]|uniref:Putative deacylase n=1 Tax=Candidatus Enterovibrio altilux TaxID=1927128 RepID=A0A291BAN1_9GAMM|nr:succinylglutamate desuccinylase/aspartoacylase family protein [Candidatus Enterovibrio luxaltus]ATF10041.1 putative deacylase [Candidatus Enterovibrio luxaltus]